MDIDLRLLIVLLPLFVALGWAGYNILQLALGQLQSFLNKQS
jgi:photosystem II PsbY protein